MMSLEKKVQRFRTGLTCTLKIAVTVWTFALILSFQPDAEASTRPSPPTKIKKTQESTPTLTDSERNSLRFKLENLWNEVDLLVRNASTDRSDLRKQESEFTLFQVFKKIPIAAGASAPVDSLVSLIKKSSADFGLQLIRSNHPQSSRINKTVPTSVYTDEPRFRFSENQLIEKTQLELTLAGTQERLEAWMATWNQIVDPTHEQQDTSATENSSLSPLLEWDPSASTRLPESLNDAKTQWKIRVQAYRFRDVHFPKLKTRNPIEVLPAWARQNPELFKSREPLLWSFVERTRNLLPKTPPLLESRAQFLLNSSRMEFFISKFSQNPS